MKYTGFALTLLLSLTVSSQFARADSIADVGDLPGGLVSTAATAISKDGMTVVGNSTNASGIEAYKWTQAGGMTNLGVLPAGMFHFSTANAVSANGSVVVGASFGTTWLQAFRWTQAGGMVGLGKLVGGSISESAAVDVSGDGNIVIGYSYSSNGQEAFRWTQAGGMVGLGDLAGGTFASGAGAISDDGTVIVGFANSANGEEAFRWTQAGGMVGLGDLAGGIYSSSAKAVSNDGSVIAGVASSANGSEAFRWTQATGMFGLGGLPGGNLTSNASAMNADGSIIVGSAADASTMKGFVWTQASGMRSVEAVLQSNGVNITGWDLSSAADIDGSGNIVVGNATYGGNSVGYIANITTGGLTTPTDMANGISTAVIPSQQAQSAGMAAIGQSLFAATRAIPNIAAMSVPQNMRLASSKPSEDIAPAAGDADEVAPILTGTKYSAFLVGSAGIGQNNNFNNYDLNGTLGLTAQMNREFAVGLGIIESQISSETSNGGEARLNAQGGTIIAAYKGDKGIRLYGSSFAAHLSSETERVYLNGSGTSESRGKTTGFAYGAAVRGGYEFKVNENNSVTPYVEIQGSKSTLGAYTETGGAFPASFGKSKGTQVTSRVGASVEHIVSPNLTLGASAAWGHRVKDDSDPLSVSMTGYNTNLTRGETGDKDWAEASVSASWNVATNTIVSAELSGRSGKTQDNAVSLSVGLKYSF